MGPQVGTCGESAMPLTGSEKRSTLQWGRRLVPAESRRNSATTSTQGSLQWGRRLVPAERRANRRDRRLAQSFNGAAGWYLRRAYPRSAGCRSTARFNGAAGWYLRRAIHSGSDAAVCLLQWGRRLVPAESAGPRRGGELVLRASMGPQVGTCGELRNSAAPTGSGVASMGPQVGTCGEARCPRQRGSIMGWLQWGRRLVPAERISALG